MNIHDRKADIRESVHSALHQFPPQERTSASAAIESRIRRSAVWGESRRVLLFRALRDEPDLDALIASALAAGKTVALPRYAVSLGTYEVAAITNLSQDCATGRHGVVEPTGLCPKVELNQLDLVVLPGVAFDPDGRRLGRGKGYYDRLLERFRGIKCGVAFDCQIVAELPEEPHDVKLNCLATPLRWMEFPPANRL